MSRALSIKTHARHGVAARMRAASLTPAIAWRQAPALKRISNRQTLKAWRAIVKIETHIKMTK